MKIALLVFALTMFAVCERPPSPDVDHSKHDHSNANHGAPNHSQMQSSTGAADAPHALQFIDTMITHHRGAIDMALLAGTRSQRSEVKQLAQEIISEQRREIAQLQEWRAKWFGDAKSAVNMDFPGMQTGMAGMDMVRLGALKANEFDVEFVRQMIPHHEGAIEMARALNAADEHPELKELAKKIELDQTAEIAKMKSWLGAWSATTK